MLAHLGLDPRALLRNLAALPAFLADWRRYQAKCKDPRFRATFGDLYPVFHDRADAAGAIGGDYFHQDLWAARKIYQRRPASHVDIGSRIDGFVAHLLTFMPVTLVDIRPVESSVEGLTFIHGDATNLDIFADDSVDSLSSLSAAEHFGLGRYSDPIDPEACFRFMRAMERVLAPGGRLYFGVPVGRERLEFNAHRIFAIGTIVAAFPRLKLVTLSVVGQDGTVHRDVELEIAATDHYSSDRGYAAGLFEFTK